MHQMVSLERGMAYAHEGRVPPEHQDATAATALPETVSWGLRQTSRATLEYEENLRGYHDEQSDLTLKVRLNGLMVGWLDFSKWHGEVAVQMIWVEPGVRGNGYGRAMLQELQRRNPGVEIGLGLATEDGAGFLEHISFVEYPSEYAKDLEALVEARHEGARVQAVADAFFERGTIPTPEERAIFDADMERWNEVHDRIWELEQATFGKSPIKRLILLPEEAL